ncbi:MAG: hypothetical protein JXA42_13200 [Anaerolineales bacterium]|nr:hypothetical protein [Anaerolineales bacterium]
MKKYWRKIALWIVMGCAFGTFTGIIARRISLDSLTGGMLAGMVAAPILVILLLLINNWDKLIIWAIAGAIAGAASLSLMTYITNYALKPLDFKITLTTGGTLDRALIGAAITTWFAAGGSMFKKGTSGIIGFLVSAIFGAPLGACVWKLGDIIGGSLSTFTFLGQVSVWAWGETLMGAPIGILAGYITTRYLFVTDFEPPKRKRDG